MKDQKHALENTTSYKDIIRKSTSTEQTPESVEINIDSIQNQESDDEQVQEFVAVSQVDSKEIKETEVDLEGSEDSEYVIDHTFSRQQKHIK